MKDLYFCVQTDSIDGPIAQPDGGECIVRSGTEEEMSDVFNKAVISADFPYVLYGKVLKTAQSEYTVQEL